MSFLLALLGHIGLTGGISSILPMLTGVGGIGGIATVIGGFFKHGINAVKPIILIGFALLAISFAAYYFWQITSLDHKLVNVMQNNNTTQANNIKLATANAALAMDDMNARKQVAEANSEITRIQVYDNQVNTNLAELNKILADKDEQEKERIVHDGKHSDLYMKLVNKSSNCLVENFGHSTNCTKKRVK